MDPWYLGITAVGQDPIALRPKCEHLFRQELHGHHNDHVVPSRPAAHATAYLGEAEVCVEHQLSLRSTSKLTGKMAGGP